MKNVKNILLLLFVMTMYVFSQVDMPIPKSVTATLGKSDRALPSMRKATGVGIHLGNHIWFDHNQNGIQDLGESGIEGVEVKLYGTADCTGEVLRETVSSDAGFYEFANIPQSNNKGCIGIVYPDYWTHTVAFQGNSEFDSNLVSMNNEMGKIRDISFSQTNHNLDAGLHHKEKNCQITTLTNGLEGTYGFDNTWAYRGTLNVEFNDVVAHAYCSEVNDSGPKSGEKYVVHEVDRLNFSTQQKDHLSRVFGYKSDKEVIALIDEAFENHDRHYLFNRLSNAFIWFYADWDRDMYQLDYYITHYLGTISSHEEEVLKRAVRLVVNKTEGTNGATQYAAMKVYYLWNSTTDAHQDLIVPQTGVIPNNQTCPIGAFPHATIGNHVWLDINYNGIQDASETQGVKDITVDLYNDNNVKVNSSVTNNNGDYLFMKQALGDYYLQFSLPSGYSITSKDKGGDDCKDSDVSSTGKSNTTTLSDGEDDRCWDMGIYITPAPAINIETLTNGVDADAPTGPSIGFGENVIWTYVVKNTGNVLLKDVVVTDSNQICTVASLAVGASESCTKTGKAIAGQYVNIGTVKAKSTLNVEVEDTDRSHYLGGQEPTTVPITVNDSQTGVSGNAVVIDVLANDSDLENDIDPTTVKLFGVDGVKTSKLTVIGEGVWTVNPTTGVVTFTPEAGFTSDPTPIKYRVKDSAGGTSGEATITVDYPQTVPTAKDDSKTGVSGNAVVIDILANDSDLENDIDPTTVKLFGVDGVKTSKLTVDGEGIWTVNPTTGVVTFSPEAGFAGNPTPIKYRVKDKSGGTSGEATITVDYPQTVPTAKDDSKTGVSGNAVVIDVLANDSDAEGDIDPTTVQLFGVDGVKTSKLTVEGEGVWTVSPTTGTVTFTPEVGFTGDPTPIKYRVKDSAGGTSGEASITVDYPQSAPVTLDDKKVSERCKVTIIDILSNDTDSENDIDVKLVNLIVPEGATGTDTDGDNDIDKVVVPNEGTWSVDASGKVTYTPSEECTDSPSNINYTVTDKTDKKSNASTISIVYPEAEKSSLGNFVWFDADKNGKQDSGEVGLEGITVELYNANNELNETVVTDENGTYGFVNLEAGEYSLKFIPKEGYAFTIQCADDVAETLNSDADIETGKTDSITLTEGENNIDIDAGMYIMAKPSIDIVKTTNGGNVNNIVAGDVITWTYKIINSGNTVVNTIVVSDDKEGEVTDCDGDDSLNPGQSMTCTKVGTAILGSYSNLGYVEGLDPEGNKISCEHGSSYVGKDAPVTLGTVGNYVWLDSNRNGIQDTTELALQDISVQLFDKSNKLISSTKTNASGNYLFKDVLTGEYTVQFVIPNGYTVTVKEAGNEKEKDSNSNINGKTSLFTLGEGANDLSIDLGLYPTLTNLGDRVFLDANANGIQDDEEKQGVANVNVKLYKEDNTFVSETKTTSTGQYLFRNLVPENYYVVFTIPAKYKVSPKNQGGNESDDSDADTNGKTEVVTLVGGQDNKAVDMGLYQEAIKLGDRVFYDMNKNGIQDAGETGVGEVEVKLYRVGTTQVVDSTQTSASGIYLFDKVVAGEYYIIFTKPVGYTITKAGQGTNETDSDPDSSGRTVNFTLLPGTQDSSIDMGVYQDVVSYGDRVFLDTNHNGLQDLGEKGVRDINVTIYSATSDFSRTMLTDENGNYLFTHLPAGEYSAEFRDIPYGHLITERDVNNNESDLNDSDAFLEDKKIITEVALLTPGKNDLSWDLGIYKTVCLPGKSVLGNLVFEDFNKDGIQDIGEPGVAAVKVTLFNNDTDTEIANTTTDENGLYEFAHVDPEFNYYVQFTVPAGFIVSPQDQDNDTIDSDADETGKTEVIVLESDQINSTIDMGIYREGSIIGDRVFFDELNGVSNGIQDASEIGANDIKVTLYAADGTELQNTRTNVSGEYHFTNVAAGSYTIGFSELPSGYVFTSPKQGNDDEKDSDVNTNGRTNTIIVNGHVNVTSIDAGLKKVSTGISSNDIKSGITSQNVILDVLANDTEGTFNFDVSTLRITTVPDGATLSQDGRTLTVPNEGVWSVNPNTGAITFTPANGFVGDPTTIAYSVQDTQGNETGADVEVNYPPLAVNDNVNAQVGTQVIVYVLENDSNTSSPLDVTSLRLIDPISGDEVETVSVPGQGTWNINIDGTVTFTPDAEFVNNPTPIEYVVREVAGDVSNRATITIVYPDAVDDIVIVPVGTTGSISINVAENDSNNTVASTVTIGCMGAGVDTLVVNGEGRWNVRDTGTIVFTPEAGFIGEPTDIKYTIGLVSGERSNCATVDIRQELLVIDDSSTLNVGGVSLINILANDFGALNTQSVQLVLPLTPVTGSTLSTDGTVLTVPGEGVWSVNDLGIVTFTAEDGFNTAPTAIRYTVENNNGLVSNIGNISFTEGGISVVANDDTGIANAGNPVIIDVLNNDTGDLNRSSVRIITADGEEVTTYVVPGEGTWIVGENGSITFTGESGFVGTPTPIRYIVSDNSVIVLSDTATVNIEGTCDCRPYETSIPAMGQLAAFLMLILTLLITMLFLREESISVKKCYN